MKVGDRLNFKKFYWKICEKKKDSFGNIEYRYRVYRRYFRKTVALSYTQQSYPIQPWRWNFIKKELKKNPNFHYNMTLWSNSPR